MTKRKNIPAQTRFSVLSRDRFTCRYCSRSAPEVELHVDHVTPVVKGGGDEMENLVTACVECNLGKSDATVGEVPAPITGRATPRQHPLTGYAVLTFRNGKLDQQGLITAVVETPTPTALIQYFDWIMGDPNYLRLIPLNDMTFGPEPCDPSRTTYRLFPSNQDRNDYYEWKCGRFEEGAC